MQVQMGGLCALSTASLLLSTHLLVYLLSYFSIYLAVHSPGFKPSMRSHIGIQDYEDIAMVTPLSTFMHCKGALIRCSTVFTSAKFRPLCHAYVHASTCVDVHARIRCLRTCTVLERAITSF